ncbi:MAG: hypothetical protein EZS28_004775 [Streblomastix strix]|uniref:BART domain-containing protein n=1 Tax=Streblomastix strix TaxID=222440 RepID=A0A5J4WZT1_9EUKA|nr:MAG: hypothetical protein EZS28_004770 [Streblomastix strix]KAA6399704.1 MAG: hypothetical protein EZS28_004775 [Streblomastix strix]
MAQLQAEKKKMSRGKDDEDTIWVLDAVLSFVQSEDFKTKISNFLETHCAEFCASTDNDKRMAEIFDQYSALYNSEIT